MIRLSLKAPYTFAHIVYPGKIMNAAVVIQRELRAESRGAANYWLRVLAAGSMIVIFATFILTTHRRQSQLGGVLFFLLQRTLFYGCWTLVPLMTADCVSRERREGTLGLLFLTPLSPLDVILGKGAAHILRVVTLFLAALPVLGLPFVLGGVHWLAALSAAVHLAGAVLLGIAAGLYASTKGGSAIQAMVRAEGYGLCVAIMSYVCHFALHLILSPIFRIIPGPFLFLGFSIALDITLFSAIIKGATRRLQTTWQQESAAAEQPAWVKIFSTSEFWKDVFRWDKSRTLDRNPMAWLQEYSWTARLTKWGWFLTLILAELIILAQADSGTLLAWQLFITAALISGIAFSAAGSFRRERQSGLLELLLVTPVSAGHLVAGRIWGICCHFLPAIAMLVVGWTGHRLLHPKLYQVGPLHLLFLNPLIFSSVLVLGLFLSLGRVNFLLAWLITCVVAFVIPVVASIILMTSAIPHLFLAFVLPSAFHLVLGIAFWFLLRRNLRLRQFLEREPK